MLSILETIKQAAGERKVLKIIYREKDGTSDGWRYVEPYSFSHDYGEDGLFAWDISKAGIRRFSIDRIEDAQITDDAYNSRYEVEI
jgi:predicted DNA-binding transcriptional regulator YafY